MPTVLKLAFTVSGSANGPTRPPRLRYWCRHPAVFYDELLAKPLRQPLTHQASDDVDSAAGSKPAIQRTCRVEEPSTASEPVMSQLHDARIR
jgi:hypothetical protein